MKKNKLCFAASSAVILLALSSLASCNNNKPQASSSQGSDAPTSSSTSKPASDKYTVTFMVDGQVYSTVQVNKNRRVAKPDDPTKTGSDGTEYRFLGWYTEADVAWDFDTDIVESDITLIAKFQQLANYPTNVKMADLAVTSTIVWNQSSLGSSYVVSLKESTNADAIIVEGTTTFDAANNLVTFVPTTSIPGGKYIVEVKDSAHADHPAIAEECLFHGDGSKTNPFLIASELDWTAVAQQDVAKGVYFKLYEDITITSSRSLTEGKVFNGTLDGNGKTVTMNLSNSAAIYKVGADGYVSKLYIAGAISSALNDSIGGLADYNAGTIEKVWITAAVTSEAGTVGSSGIAATLNESGEAGTRGIAGGVVGTNEVGGKIISCSIKTTSSSVGVVKARIGGGCIVGYNKGEVSYCTSEGCFGAWNSTESGGKSISNYSYSGGICGINAGTITRSSLTGAGKVLAQRNANGATQDPATCNSYIGGIAGLNSASGNITECSYSGIRVHADLNVGGIAGSNAGRISDCAAEGRYSDSTKVLSYVGGRSNVGGIVGDAVDGSSVTNCISTVNVYAFEANGYSVAKDASNCVYLASNPNANSLSTNPDPIANVAPNGTNNSAITVPEGSGAANFKVAQDYLSIVNGNNAFAYKDETVTLAYEAPTGDTMDVRLHSEGSLWKTVSVGENKTVLDVPTKSGYRFSGWSLSEGAEIYIEPSQAVSLYDFSDLVVTISAGIDLYANFVEREVTSTLNVAIYDRYVEDTDESGVYTTTYTDKIIDDFKTSVGELSYQINVHHYAQKAVADFGAAINAADPAEDVIIGSGANITTSGGVPTITKALLREGLVKDTGRQAALLTDTPQAIEFYGYLIGVAHETAEVTIYGDDMISMTTTLDSILKNKADIPTVTVADSKMFAGWATSAESSEVALPIALDSNITYSVVSSLVKDGKLSLYPVLNDKPEPSSSSQEESSSEASSEESQPSSSEETMNKTLNLYVHGSASSSVYITEQEATRMVDVFKALYAPDANIDLHYIAGKSATGLANDITAATDADIWIGGNNIDTSSGAVFDATCPKAAVGAGHFENTSRKIGLVSTLNEEHREFATLFYNFMKAEFVNTFDAAFWGNDGAWVSESEETTIKEGIANCLKNFGFAIADGTDDTATEVKLNWSDVAGSENATLGAATNALNEGKGVDFIVGCDANVKTEGGINVAASKAVASSFMAAGRYVSNVSDSSLARLVYAYYFNA